MKRDDLINAIGEIDETIVAAAAPGAHNKYRRPLWYMVIAACMAVVIAISLLVPRFGAGDTPPVEGSTPATTTATAASATETTATTETTTAATTTTTEPTTAPTVPTTTATTAAPTTEKTVRTTKVVVFENRYSTRLTVPEGSLYVEALTPEEKTLRSVSAFCFNIFRELYNGENMVVAPLPTYMQLAMLRHDSSGETREQLEALLHMDAETGDAQLRGLLDKIVYDDNNGSYTKIANSLWFKGSTRNPQFLTNAIGYYDAEIFACREMDDDTCAELNNWVASKTDNLIPKLLDKFPANTTMNLTATLTAAAKWGGEATESQGVFYSLNGSENNVTYLETPSSGWGIDSVLYQLAVRSMGNSTLYLIEPKEGTTIDELLGSLGYTFISNPRLYGGDYYKKCYITLPQFCSEYRTDLSESLKKMGATAMFDPGKNAEYVSDVISQAVFETTKEGVHGAAASSITHVVRGPQSETMYMKADRPFIYILADSDTNIPLFIGVQTDMG